MTILARRLLYASSMILLVAAVTLTTGCGDDNDQTNNAVSNNGADAGNNGNNNADGGPADGGGDSDTTPDPHDCSTYEELSQDFDEDVVLDGCYQVTDTLTADNGAVVTIEPGSVLQFEENAGLEIWSDARLHAAGTADANILFTGAQQTPGFWKGISYNETNGTENVLDYATIEYAGGDSLGYVESTSLAVGSHDNTVQLSVTNTTIRNGGSVGLYVEDQADLTFENNTITGHAEAAAEVHVEELNHLNATSSYSGNEDEADQILVFADTFDEDQMVTKLDVPYFIVDGLYSETSTMEIEAGTKMIFAENTGVRIWSDARLTAQGSEGSEIVFTGAEETPGFWQGVMYNESNGTDNVLDHVIIEYGGGEAHPWVDASANLALGSYDGSTRVAITNTTIQHSGATGLYAEDDITAPEFENNTLTSNAAGAATVDADSIDLLDSSSTYSGNASGEDFVYVFERNYGDDKSMAGIDVPYFLNDGLYSEESVLTIEPGASLVFNENTSVQIWYDARLDAAGTADEPIVFTAAEEIAGYWRGVMYNESNGTDNVLEHVTIEYGGGEALPWVDESANLAIGSYDGPSRVALDTVTIANSGKYGIWTEENVTITGCDTVTFDSNADANIDGALTACP